MTQSDQGNTPDGSSSIPMKRKRGRPRKYPKPDLEENAHVINTPNLNMGENAGKGVLSAPPGFLGRNGYQPRRRAPTNGAADVMVGIVVSGAIDATFDGGYLLGDRVGNSPTTLRGVIFKPGRCVPVSAENDVAPDVQMIRRNVIPNPAEISHFHGSSPRSRDAIRFVNHVASKRKHMVPVAPQTANPLLSRGNLLPVILQPRNLSEGVPLTGLPNSVAPGAPPTNGSIRTNRVPLTNEVANQSSDLATSKVKQVPSVHPSNGLISTRFRRLEINCWSSKVDKMKMVLVINHRQRCAKCLKPMIKIQQDQSLICASAVKMAVLRGGVVVAQWTRLCYKAVQRRRLAVLVVQAALGSAYGGAMAVKGGDAAVLGSGGVQAVAVRRRCSWLWWIAAAAAVAAMVKMDKAVLTGRMAVQGCAHRQRSGSAVAEWRSGGGARPQMPRPCNSSTPSANL